MEADKQRRKLSPYLFVNRTGALIHPDTFTKRLRKIYDAIGFPREYHLHTLRHYFVTSLLHCGVDKQTVADLVGHADTGFWSAPTATPSRRRRSRRQTPCSPCSARTATDFQSRRRLFSEAAQRMIVAFVEIHFSKKIVIALPPRLRYVVLAK